MLHGRYAAVSGANLRGSRAGNPTSQIIVPQSWKYQRFAWQRSKGSIDDYGCYVYPFRNAGDDRFVGLIRKALPTALWGLWGRNQFEARGIASFSRFGAVRRHRLLARVAWHHRHARRPGTR